MTAVSFIICTIENSGREQRLNDVISAVKKQAIESFEIILVWQGLSCSMVPCIEGVDVVHINTFSSSVSRNVGAAHAKYEFICFLDDDTFPVNTDFTKNALSLLTSGVVDFLTFNIRSEGEVMAAEQITKDVPLNRAEIVRHLWEPGLMLSTEIFKRVLFDATLGIGALHGSSEGFDLGARLLQHGFKGRRVSNLFIDHPPLAQGQTFKLERAFLYSLGNSSSLVQHGYYREYALQLAKALVRLLFALLSLNWAQARIRAVRLLSMIIGPLIPRTTPRLVPTATAASSLQETLKVK